MTFILHFQLKNLVRGAKEKQFIFSMNLQRRIQDPVCEIVNDFQLLLYSQKPQSYMFDWVLNGYQISSMEKNTEPYWRYLFLVLDSFKEQKHYS